jgi:hypothetical protein
LNEKFVCFAPGWFINSEDETYQAAWKRFYLAQSEPTEGNGWLTGTNLVLMTAAGRLLSGAVEYGRQDGLGPALQEVLDAYAALPVEQRICDSVPGEIQPVPAPPEGGLVLTIYDRPIARADGQYRLPEGDDLGSLRTHAPAGQRSSLWLTREECASLIPDGPRTGDTHAVPTKLAKRVFLYGLCPQAMWVLEHAWQPDAVREGELHVTVEDAAEQALRLRVHGSVVLSTPSRLRIYPTGNYAKDVENRYDARLEGSIFYDRVQQRIARWDMVALGEYTGAMFTARVENGQPVGDDQWREATAESPVALAFAFELDDSAYDTPPERRRPRSFVHAYIFREQDPFYWDPDLWEADWRRRAQQ